MATEVPDKTASTFAVSWAASSLERLGLSEMILQVDQEPSMEAIARAIQAKRGVRTQIRLAPRFAWIARALAAMRWL